MMKTILYPPGEVYYALEEGSTRDYDFTGKLQSAYEALEIYEASRMAVGKRVQ